MNRYIFLQWGKGEYRAHTHTHTLIQRVYKKFKEKQDKAEQKIP